jgi:hypothetical protein
MEWMHRVGVVRLDGGVRSSLDRGWRKNEESDGEAEVGKGGKRGKRGKCGECGVWECGKAEMSECRKVENVGVKKWRSKI